MLMLVIRDKANIKIDYPVSTIANPDKTIFFDIEPEEGLARIAKNENREVNRLDIEKIEFHKSVREGYLELLKRYPNRIKRIDASQPREVVAAECEKYILEVLKGE